MNPTPEALGGHNLAFAEELFERYLEDPSWVAPEWRALFASLGENGGPRSFRPAVRPRSIFNPRPSLEGAGEAAVIELQLQDRLDQLVQAYRTNGHLEANLDPLDRPRPPHKELDPASYGLTREDMDRYCSSGVLGTDATVGQVIRRLRNTYCRYIGVQFMHMDSAEARQWLVERMEYTENRLRLSHFEQVNILSKLTDAEVFEQFIRRKWLGAKSFSLEGGESLIPLLDLAIERAAEQGVEEVVLGMAHRGRLNVLANIMHKSPSQIFREFEDADNERYWGSGDVKYHMGYRAKHVTTQGQTVSLRLAFNPSHLEFVDPVVLGRVRARQDRSRDAERKRVLPILLHGDAAFAGQGIIQEVLNMSELGGYRTGGTLHVIVNNQIGFTTPPESSRSSLYCTDVARMLMCPIFHVNGEHPESVAQVVQLAMDFREAFRTDVFIDMYCYRRHGHNEGDEPAFTQPLMYELIRKRPTVRESYLRYLLKPNGLTQDQADRILEERTMYLEEELSRARDKAYSPTTNEEPTWPWTGYKGGHDHEVEEAVTGVGAERLDELMTKLTTLPEDFGVLDKLEKMLDKQRDRVLNERVCDWAAGEALAFASLLVEGHPVRLSGQDSGRGTFSHRHAVIRDVRDERRFIPLQHLAVDQAHFEVWDSPLTESAVLGFEWGYSLDRPNTLVIWEAQFGDFVNAAQVIIDQFISSAEDKWGLLSGLVLLLPHGFEGQGPEHSSARLERFLQMCAEDNMQVVNLTTPAQIFHCLRRQVLRPWRKPLVVLSPKSLLRHPRAVSPFSELVEGSFQRVLADPALPEQVRRVLLCSGKVYYDLEHYREQRDEQGVAILRLEQLYPFPEDDLRAALEPIMARRAPGLEKLEVVWVQEEPANMGAWYYLRARFGETLWGELPFSCVARNESASPATGSPGSHKREQEFLVARAFFSQRQEKAAAKRG